jgi:peptide/nickel transport system permease protein
MVAVLQPTRQPAPEIEAEMVATRARPAYLHFLVRDPVALLAAFWLVMLVAFALFGPWMVGDAANSLNLRARAQPALTLENGWINVLGADALGRSILARIIVATRVTLGIALSSALLALLIGTLIGIWAGFVGGIVGRTIMQISDILQSFPSILLAMVVLYILSPSPVNLILVLTIGQLPVYIRVARAEVLELRERLFVDAARVIGARPRQIIRMHIAPMVAPTVINVVTIDFALIMLSESSLSFLGIGVQAPSITWGLMVSQGKDYLETAWWMAFFPGLMIMLTTLSINLLANWLRRMRDPRERWRFERAKAR